MKFIDCGLQKQPFDTQAEPIIHVPVQSQRAAHMFLGGVLTDNRGIGMLYGPELSGKTTVCNHFVHSLDKDIAAAVIDGASVDTTALLSKILSQFGYAIEYNSLADLLNMIRVFAVQKTRTGQAPVIVIENFDSMTAGALNAVCGLAKLTVRYRFALRFILVSTCPSFSVLHSSTMNAIAERLTDVFGLEPMSLQETVNFIYSKLKASSAIGPERIFPMETCEMLHMASDGWPGLLEDTAALAIERAQELPIRSESIRTPDPWSPTIHGHRPAGEGRPAHFATLN